MKKELEQAIQQAAKDYAADVFGDYDPESQSEFDHFYNHLIKFSELLKGANLIAGELEEARKEKWVRVEDGLPEVGKPVFVWMNNGNWNDFCIAEMTEGSEWYKPFKRVSDVTHWQPLPEQPLTTK